MKEVRSLNPIKYVIEREFDLNVYYRTYAFFLKVPDKGDLGGLKDRNYRFLRPNVRYLRNVRKSCTI